MQGLHVPELRRKLEMLVVYGPHGNLADIAYALGKSPVTLRGWCNGASGQAPETLPRRNVSAFVGLYESLLSELTEQELLSLLTGPADNLEELLSAGSETSLRRLIREEADASAAILHLDDSSLGLVRRARKDTSSPQYRVRLGQAFRIEVPSGSRAGFVVALQSAPSGWGAVPFVRNSDDGVIHMPGGAQLEGHEFMIEDNELGTHSFLVAQGAQPFPPEIINAGRNGIALDRTLLAHFERSCRAQDKSTRRLFVIEIEFTPRQV